MFLVFSLYEEYFAVELISPLIIIPSIKLLDESRDVCKLIIKTFLLFRFVTKHQYETRMKNQAAVMERFLK